MINRTMDAAFLNEVCNHPEVHPWLGHEGVIDVTPAVSNPANFALVTEGGGFIVIQHEPGVYEVHSQFLPEARDSTVQAMRDGMDYVFTRTDCHTLLTQVPDNNKAALHLAKCGGFKKLFWRELTPRGPTAFMALRIDEWIQGNAELEADGEWFHDKLEAAKEAFGSQLPIHPHDPAHERAVGASVRMMKAGNYAKAVVSYNRWAGFAGYAPIALISQVPPLIDVGDAVIEIKDRDMEVVLCR